MLALPALPACIELLDLLRIANLFYVDGGAPTVGWLACLGRAARRWCCARVALLACVAVTYCLHVIVRCCCVACVGRLACCDRRGGRRCCPVVVLRVCYCFAAFRLWWGACRCAAYFRLWRRMMWRRCHSVHGGDGLLSFITCMRCAAMPVLCACAGCAA